jgi:hypothetical protein
MWHAWERRGYKVLVEKAEGKRPHGRPRRRWIRMNLRDIPWGGGECSGSSWLRIGSGGGLL